MAASIYHFTIQLLSGEALSLQEYEGRFLLLVNTASACGFTPQYAQMQEFYTHFGKEIGIIAFPCNQFGNQEPGTNAEIATFCQKNYGVSFPVSEKIAVKGENISPLYAWLTQKTHNQFADSEVAWNFQKYLINPQGALYDIFAPSVSVFDPKVLAAIGIKL
ncbi:MAG: glutathione peroxidase [Chitinophagales bacterium]